LQLGPICSQLEGLSAFPLLLQALLFFPEPGSQVPERKLLLCLDYPVNVLDDVCPLLLLEDSVVGHQVAVFGVTPFVQCAEQVVGDQVFNLFKPSEEAIRLNL
jgi:hypothetical protein